MLAAVAVFLPWKETAAQSAAGTQLGVGRVVFIVSLVTVALIQVRWRPAWIGAGFVVAVNARGIFELAGSDTSEIGPGLWLSTVTALAAAALLVWDMFAGVAAQAHDGADAG